MKQKINKPQLNQWKKTFKLNYNWQTVPNSLICNFGLATLNNKINTGYLIAEQQLKVNNRPKLNQKLTAKAEIINQKEFTDFNYLSCQVTVKNQAQQLVKLNSKLIKTETNSRANHSKQQAAPNHWRQFSAKEVQRFSQMAQDPNPIHLSNRPIVQGMLLFLTLEDHLAQQNRFLKQSTIKYLAPIYSEQSIKLNQPSQNKILGSVDNNLCFSLMIKEELT